MKILAISGSARVMSTNTALLRALQAVAPEDIDVFDGIGNLPVFSADREGANLPGNVRSFLDKIKFSDGLIISSPEYVSIPGG
jgi:NAD(P)H-dependent FMN reductase